MRAIACVVMVLVTALGTALPARGQSDTEPPELNAFAVDPETVDVADDDGQVAVSVSSGHMSPLEHVATPHSDAHFEVTIADEDHFAKVVAAR